MANATKTSRTAAKESVTLSLNARSSRDRNPKSIMFLIALWFSLFFGLMVLIALIVDTALTGAPRFDLNLITQHESTLRRDETGFRAGILGSIWLIGMTAVLAIPLGIAAAVYLEEFAKPHAWYNRLIEVNVQNLAAVPAIIYGMLAAAIMGMLGYGYKGIVLGGAFALALLILPVVIITTREAVRAVPREIRDGSFALGATIWQTTWRNILPSAVPGIATGTILGLSRAVGEAAPLLILGLATVRFDPIGIESKVTALPIQIYNLSSAPQEELQVAASAAIIVLLILILSMNGLAIFIRNRFQKTW